jgi:deazaflavin-dependent oxidoreductase (nitroreductase family)
MTSQNDQIIEEFRRHAGKVSGSLQGAPLLLLTAIGARSGKQWTLPLRYLLDGGRLVVFAANAGGPRHPAWYYNLVAHPHVTIELGSEIFEAEARFIEGAERDQLLVRQATQYPHFATYQAKTTRQIPVVALERQIES